MSVILTSLALGWRLAIYLTAGVLAGISNGIAGGGTFITFPTMLALGVPALQANVSSSVGVLPSYIGGLRGYRKELTARWPLVRQLIPASLLGTGLGAALLLLGPASQFKAVVPWLIGAATCLFASAPWLTRRLTTLDHHHPTRRRSLHAGIFLAAVYGGYFGAGLGIILLAVMSLTLSDDMGTMQGLRSALSTLINFVAAVIFAFHGHLLLEAVVMLFCGTLLGGWIGTLLIQRLRANTVRVLIVLVGLITTVRLALA